MDVIQQKSSVPQPVQQPRPSAASEEFDRALAQAVAVKADHVLGAVGGAKMHQSRVAVFLQTRFAEEEDRASAVRVSKAFGNAEYYREVSCGPLECFGESPGEEAPGLRVAGIMRRRSSRFMAGVLTLLRNLTSHMKD